MIQDHFRKQNLNIADADFDKIFVPQNMLSQIEQTIQTMLLVKE